MKTAYDPPDFRIRRAIFEGLVHNSDTTRGLPSAWDLIFEPGRLLIVDAQGKHYEVTVREIDAPEGSPDPSPYD